MVNKKSLKIKLNFYHALLFMFIYCFGLYSFRKIEPVWANTDGLVFFWITQTTLAGSLLAIILFQLRVKKSNLIKHTLTIILKTEDIFVYISIIFYLLIVNYALIKNDLFGDELSYAKYSIWHFEYLIRIFPRNIISNYSGSILLQLTILLAILFTIHTVKIFKKFAYQKIVYASLIATILLRIANEAVFKFDNLNTEPLTVFYQISIPLFGFNSLSFRITSVVVYSGFMFLIYIISNRYLVMNKLNSILISFTIGSIPLGLSASTKIDHGVYSFFATSILLLSLFSKRKVPEALISFFLVCSVFFSLTNFSLIAFLIISFLRTSKQRKQLIKHIINESSIYIFLLPQITMHFLRVIRDMHLAPYITNYKPVSIYDRVRFTYDAIFTGTEKYITLMVFLSIIFSIVNSSSRKFNLFLFLVISFFMQAILVNSGAIGWNRYTLQWFYPFYFIVILFLLMSSYFKSAKYLVVAILISINTFSFANFSKSYNNFDKYIVDNKWNYNLTIQSQPKNVIWPPGAFESFINEQNNNQKNDCVIVGFTSAGIPELLSGSTYYTLREKLQDYSFSRKFRDSLTFFAPGQTIDKAAVNCVVISNHFYKDSLVQTLLLDGWRISKTFNSDNGIRLYEMLK